MLSSKGIFQTQGSNPHLLTRPVLTGRFHTTSATWEATFLYTWSVVNQLHSDLDKSCTRISVTSIKNTAVDFPGGPVRNLPVSAGDTSSIPVLGIKIPQAAWQRLNPCASTAEATHLEPVCAPQQEKPQREARTLQLESSPRLLQLEKAHMQQWTPSAAKK